MNKKQLLLATALCSTAGLFAQTAELQVIHNAADPAAQAVDIYVNGVLTLDDFAFREATEYLSVPAGTLLNIGVAAGNSSSVNDTLRNFPVNLLPGERYVAMANGVLNPANFAANPNGVPTGFTLFLASGMRSTADNASNVEFRVVHGASDAPTVDIAARGVATLVNDASYSDITSYFSVPPTEYLLDLTLAAGTPLVATFEADLTGLDGGTAVVFASGFLNPAANQNGEEFGIFAALADGTVIELDAVTTAELQVIHNAADPAAAVVDVYLDGAILLDDFAFRTATPFIDAPANQDIEIAVAPGTSTSVADALATFTVNLLPGGTYLAVANGVLDPMAFEANPDAVPTEFTLFLQDMMRTEAENAGNVEFRVVHGASDAPAVDVIARGVATLVEDAAYSDISIYMSVPAASYTIDIAPAAGSPVIAAFTADLSGLAGGSAVVFASGFLSPANDQNGEAFGLFAALADGTVVQFPATTISSLTTTQAPADFRLYPNPATDVVTIECDLAAETTMELVDVMGKTLRQWNLPAQAQNFQLLTNELTNGVYFVKMNTSVVKLVIQR